jgi:hypothetical protein
LLCFELYVLLFAMSDNKRSNRQIAKPSISIQVRKALTQSANQPTNFPKPIPLPLAQSLDFDDPDDSDAVVSSSAFAQ